MELIHWVAWSAIGGFATAAVSSIVGIKPSGKTAVISGVGFLFGILASNIHFF